MYYFAPILISILLTGSFGCTSSRVLQSPDREPAAQYPTVKLERTERSFRLSWPGGKVSVPLQDTDVFSRMDWKEMAGKTVKVVYTG
jgi:hypothetical protein